MKAVGYIRVSSRKQAQEGESLADQRKSIEAYAESQGWQLLEIYSDEGISGKDMKNREGMKRLLRDAEAKRFNAVVVKRITRFGRSTVDAVRNMEILKGKGIKLVSITENMDFDTPTGKLLFTMLAAFAELDNTVRSEQSLEGKLEKLANGCGINLDGNPIVGGKLPAGYMAQDGQIVLSEQAPLIKWAAEKYLEGESLPKICEELRNQGFDIKVEGLVKIWKYRCNGILEYTVDKKKKQFTVPAILNQKTIKAVMERLEHNRAYAKGDRKDYELYPLTGFVRCGECGRSLRIASQWDRNHKHCYKYYIHSVNRDEGWANRKCRGIVSISAKKLEEMVFGHLKEALGQEEIFDRIIQPSLPSAEWIKAEHRALRVLEKRRDKENKRYDRLLKEIEEGNISGQRVRERSEEIESSIQKLDAEIEEKQAQLDNLPSPEKVEEQAKRKAGVIYTYFLEHPTLTYPDKVKLLHELFDDSKTRGDLLSKNAIYITGGNGKYQINYRAKLDLRLPNLPGSVTRADLG